MTTFQRLCQMAQCPEDFITQHDLRTPAEAAGFLRSQIIRNGHNPPTLQKVIAAVQDEFHAQQARKLQELRDLWVAS